MNELDREMAERMGEPIIFLCNYCGEPIENGIISPGAAYCSEKHREAALREAMEAMEDLLGSPDFGLSDVRRDTEE